MKEETARPPASTPPAHYTAFKAAFPSVVEAYEQLGKACHWNGPLNPKARELVKIGIAIGAGLESATRAHVRIAREAGASPEEIRHAGLLATTTVGFPAMVRAMSWINDVLAPEDANRDA